MKNVLAISGSLRAESINLKIIEYVSKLASISLKISVFQNFSQLPAFNPDLDTEGVSQPVEVVDFRRQIKEADGVLICSPEYVFAVPGALKNAIDWTVSSGEFMHKPVALITASGLGEKAHDSLLLTLRTLEAKIGENSALLISHARSKVNSEGVVSDAATIEALMKLVESFIETINAK
jgi:NAD(P)H-dependent FMN reductase